MDSPNNDGDQNRVSNLSSLHNFLVNHQEELSGIVSVLEEVNGHTHDKLLGPMPKDTTKATDMVKEDVSNVRDLASVIERQVSHIKALTTELAAITS
jgi:hypothetical protein